MATRQYQGDDALIQIVDEDDKPIGASSIPDARQHDLAHRVVRIMVEDTEGRVLLQKRSSTQDTYPNCWDNSAAGHVDEGESYEQAARRELKEEVGIEGFPLKEVEYYRVHKNDHGLKINRFIKLYKSIVPAETQAEADYKEVSEVRWFSADEIRKLATEHSKEVSDGFIEVYERLYAK